ATSAATALAGNGSANRRERITATAPPHGRNSSAAAANPGLPARSRSAPPTWIAPLTSASQAGTSRNPGQAKRASSSAASDSTQTPSTLIQNAETPVSTGSPPPTVASNQATKRPWP